MERNIYEIISEQKALVDINMASYDLIYTISNINDEFTYSAESFGSKVKEIIEKFIKFVKAFLNKIKEFVSKIFNFFRGGNDKVKTIEDKLKSANEKDDGGEGEGDNKKDEPKQDQKNAKLAVTFSGEANTIQELIKVSKGKYSTKLIGPLSKKIEIVKRLDKVEEVYDKLGDEMQKMNKGVSEFESGMLVKELKRLMLDDPNCDNIPTKLSNMFGDGDMTVTFEISSKANDIIDYVTKGGVFGKVLMQGQKMIDDEFKDYVNEVKGMAGQEEKVTEADINKVVNELQQVANIVGTIFNYTSRATLNGYNQYMALCSKLCDEYVKSKNAKATKKDRQKAKRQFMSSAPEEDPFGDEEEEE